MKKTAARAAKTHGIFQRKARLIITGHACSNTGSPGNPQRFHEYAQKTVRVRPIKRKRKEISNESPRKVHFNRKYIWGLLLITTRWVILQHRNSKNCLLMSRGRILIVPFYISVFSSNISGFPAPLLCIIGYVWYTCLLGYQKDWCCWWANVSSRQPNSDKKKKKSPHLCSLVHAPEGGENNSDQFKNTMLNYDHKMESKPSYKRESFTWAVWGPTKCDQLITEYRRLCTVYISCNIR